MDEQQREVNSCLKMVSSTGLVQRPFGQLLEEFLITGFGDEAEAGLRFAQVLIQPHHLSVENQLQPQRHQAAGVGHHLARALAMIIRASRTLSLS